MSTAPRTLFALTGLRFLAVAHVVWFHYGGKATPSQWAIERIRSVAEQELSLFFLLSGFVLTYRYSNLGPTSPAHRSFWWTRVVRIYPLHVLALLVTLTLLPAFRALVSVPDYSWQVIVANAVLIQRWLAPRGTFRSINGPSWTLSIEIFFYLVFPWLLRLVMHRHRRAWMLLLLSCLAAAAWLDWTRRVYEPGNELTRWLINFAPAFLPICVLGMVLGRRFLDSDRPAPATMSYVGAIGLVAAMLVPEPIDVLTISCQCLLIYGLAGGRGALAVVLASRPMVRLGDYSYAIYILQFPCWAAWTIVTPRLPAFVSPPLHFAIYFVLLVGVSAVATHLVADPLRWWQRR